MEGRDTVFSDVQPLKARTPMTVSPSGSSADSSAEHSRKARWPISRRPVPKRTVFSEEQPEKAYSPTVFMLSGRVTSVRPVQWKKLRSPTRPRRV